MNDGEKSDMWSFPVRTPSPGRLGGKRIVDEGDGEVGDENLSRVKLDQRMVLPRSPPKSRPRLLYGRIPEM